MDTVAVMVAMLLAIMLHGTQGTSFIFTKFSSIFFSSDFLLILKKIAKTEIFNARQTRITKLHKDTKEKDEEKKKQNIWNDDDKIPSRKY